MCNVRVLGWRNAQLILLWRSLEPGCNGARATSPDYKLTMVGFDTMSRFQMALESLFSILCQINSGRWLCGVREYFLHWKSQFKFSSFYSNTRILAGAFLEIYLYWQSIRYQNLNLNQLHIIYFADYIKLLFNEY